MLTAIIDPEQCIGCNRCVPACPFDAIIGTHQFLHTVITDKCIGCKLCLSPCPVDCIDIIPLTEQELKKIPKQIRAQNAKKQYTNHLLRQQKKNKKSLPHFESTQEKQDIIKKEIQEAILRTKNKNAD